MINLGRGIFKNTPSQIDHSALHLILFTSFTVTGNEKLTGFL